MNTMKKLFSLLAMCLLIFSCSTEDDDVANTESNYTINVGSDIQYGDDVGNIFIELPLVAQANPNPNNLSLRFTQNGTQVGANFNTLQNDGTGYRLQNNRWNISPADVEDGTVNAELYAITPENTTWQATNISTSFSIQWPDDIGPGDPEPETESVTFTTIERIVNSNGDVIYRYHYIGNSNTDGSIQIDLWQGGVNQNLTINRSLIQTDGFVDSDPMQGILNPDENYQFAITNPSEQYPEYVFLDSNGNGADSHVFNFIAEADAPMVTVSSLITDNITSISFHADLVYTIDTTVPQTLVVRLFESTDLNNPISEQEQSQQTTGNGTEIFSSMFTGLNPNIGYTFRYFLDGVQIFVGVVTTANSGSYRTEIENLISTVNDVTVTAEYDNSTGADISAIIEFLGTAIDETTLTYSEPITFINGNMNTDIVISQFGFKQNSPVTVNIIVNGIVEQTQTINTMVLLATSFQLNPGTAMIPNPNHPNPSSAMMAGYVGMTTNGDGLTDMFNLTLVSSGVLNPNSYISYIQINNGQQIAANWIEDTSNPGTWNMSISQTEVISAGVINGYDIYFGTENYTVIDPTGFDMFSLSMTITDNNGMIHGQGSNSVNLEFGN